MALMDVANWLTGRHKNVDRVADGIDRKARGTLDGALFCADWLMGLSLEGRIWVANVGTATTPVTFAVGLTDTQPSLNIDVAAGYGIIPIWIQAYLETSAGTINELVAGVSQQARGNGTSTAVVAQPFRSDRPVAGPASTIRSLYSAVGAVSLNLMEFWRAGYPFADATAGPSKLFMWQPGNWAPVIVGPHALSVWIDGTTTAPTGFLQCVFAELAPGSF